jgi:uncharacterized membrane protein YesL
MTNPFAILWKSVVNVYDDLFPMVGMNLLWLVISIPIALVIWGVFILVHVPGDLAVLLAMLVAVLAPSPASVGIHNYANLLVKEERVEFELFWTGLRTYWRRSLALLAIAVVVAAVLGVNIVFYFLTESTILRVFAILWVYAMALWFIMVLYMNPLLIEQENKSIKLILRNAFVLALDNLIPSLVLLIVLVLVSVLSIGIALLVALLAASFAATVETRAVLTYLEKYRARAANRTP